MIGREISASYKQQYDWSVGLLRLVFLKHRGAYSLRTI